MEQALQVQSTSRVWNNLETAITVWLLLLSEATLIPFPKIAQYALVLFLILRHWKRFMYVVTRDLPLCLLVITCALSFFWSAAPEITLDEMDLVWRSTLFGAYIATRYTPKEQVHLLAWVCGISAVLSLSYVLFLPSLGISITNSETTWQGIYAHKQYLGRMMVLGTVVFTIKAIDSPKHRRINLIGLSLASFLLLQSKSKASLILLLLSFLIFPAYKLIKQHYKLKAALLSVTLLLSCGGFMLVISKLETLVVNLLGKDLTFSGRTDIWIPAIQKGLEQPWLGYGYSGFWTSSASSYILRTTWAGGGDGIVRMHAHNGYIDLFLQLGFIGCALFAAGFLLTFLRILFLLEVTQKIEFFYMIQILFLIALSNSGVSSTILSGNIFWPLYVSIVLSSVIQSSRLKKIMGSAKTF